MLPLATIALSLVANWVASENIIGLTGEVACSHVAMLHFFIHLSNLFTKWPC